MATDPIEVTVRNSSGQQGDETYTVPASSTILELKWQIQQRHSQHPAPELQRLIFCGKILNNGDTIASMGPFPDGSNRVTVLLYFRSAPAAAPSPEQAAPNPPPQFAQQPNAQMPQQGVPYGQGMPPYPVFGAFPFPNAQNMGFPGAFAQPRVFVHPGMMPNQQHFPMGQPGYPGMYPAQFQWQQAPGGPAFHHQHAPVVRGFTVQFNPRYLFYGLLGVLFFLMQGGSNSMYYYGLLLAAAYVYMHAGRRRNNAPQGQNQPNGGGQGNQQPQAQQQNGAAGNQQGAENAEGAADRDNGNSSDMMNVPRILRYDWRHHRGLLGEVLGFVCPLLFSLWPTWDPSILGDHPDVVHRRQEEQQRAQAAGGDAPAQ